MKYKHADLCINDREREVADENEIVIKIEANILILLKGGSKALTKKLN